MSTKTKQNLLPITILAIIFTIFITNELNEISFMYTVIESVIVMFLIIVLLSLNDDIEKDKLDEV